MNNAVKDFLELSALPHPAVALHDNDPKTALQSFALLESFDYQHYGRCHSDVWVCGFGASLWLLGDHQSATNTWTTACNEALRGKFHYSNSGLFGPGLLLWFASVWLRDEDLREHANGLFEKLLKKRQPVMGSNNPTMFARLLRRELELEEVLQQYRTAHPHPSTPSPSHVDFERNALFYSGVAAYEANDRHRTLQLWRKIAPMEEPSLNVSYYIMLHEKSRLGDAHR